VEDALKQVQPTEFDGPAPDRAGPGTGVEIEHADGRRERFYILGAWDRDEALGIVSSDTRMAQALEGHSAGDAVSVPGTDGDRSARVTAILPLSEDVRRWVREGA
jgi:transcription elongation GreA/GreB family factor